MSFSNVNDNFSTAGDKPLSEDTTSLSGSGGDDLRAYSLGRKEQLTALHDTAPTNSSSYPTPTGFTDSAANPFGTGLQSGNGETTLSQASTDSLSGSGGAILDLYYPDRETLLKRFAGAVANESSFPTPSGFADTASNPFGVGVQNDNGERHLGLHVTGMATGPEGLPLRGTVQIFDGEGSGISTAVSSTFVVSSPPHDPVVEGEDADGPRPTFDAEFTPTVDGVHSVKEDIDHPNGGTLSTSYGIVHGYVTDVDGDPVEGKNVSGEGAFTTTDETGYYTLLAPGGTSVTLQSVDGTAEDDVQVQSGSEGTRVDWQYAGVEVRVLGPNYDPVQNAPVSIGGDVYRTDENGEVYVPDFPLGRYDVTVMDSHEDEVDLTGQGVLDKVTVQGGTRLQIRCYDAETGEEIRDVPAVDVESAALSYSNARGLVSLLSFVEEGFDVLVGEGDKRYLSEPVEESPPDGDTAEAEVTLEPKPATTNR